MKQLVIKEINIWSVARTVFPLAWIISIITIFAGLLFFGSIMESVANEFTEVPAALPSIGAVAGFFLSIGLGFMNAIFATILALITVVVYNFLAGLGGGFAVTLAEEGGGGDEPESAAGRQEADAEEPSRV